MKTVVFSKKNDNRCTALDRHMIAIGFPLSTVPRICHGFFGANSKCHGSAAQSKNIPVIFDHHDLVTDSWIQFIALQRFTAVAMFSG